ncbi:sugar nucleotide-binding protein [Candidatus Woesearchaeota archaeon]|nr:sugar nucleotide-binding protein [Candidatus Woesearchaeota archaeon]
MRFIVIGASGFVGNRILSHLLASDYDAIGTYSSRKPEPDLKGKSGNSAFIEYNLLEDKLKDCLPKGFIANGGRNEKTYAIICAAMSRIDECFLNKELSYKLNVERTINLLYELKELGIKPVFFSSSQVFDGKKGPYTEKSKPAPVCEYGKQKLEVERFIQKEVPDSIIIRTDKVIDDHYMKGQTLSDWYDAVKAKKAIYCIEGKTMSPTAVADMANAVRLLCEKNLSGIYHVANTEFFTRESLAKEFVKALEAEADVATRPVEFFNFADKRSIETHLDSGKFIKATGMRFTTMREVFNRFINK